MSHLVILQLTLLMLLMVANCIKLLKKLAVDLIRTCTLMMGHQPKAQVLLRQTLVRPMKKVERRGIMLLQLEKARMLNRHIQLELDLIQL